MRTILAVTVSLLLVALISIAGWSLSRQDKAAPELARLEKELKKANDEIKTLKEELAAERKKTASQSLEKKHENGACPFSRILSEDRPFR